MVDGPVGGRRLRALIFRTLVLAIAIAAAGGAQALDQCPYNANYVNLSDGQQLSCACPQVDTFLKKVYGTDRYASDSDLCAAALHAGAIPSAGGDVTVFGGAGCQAFVGSSRHGVDSVGFGAYGKTIAFANPLPPCNEIGVGTAYRDRLTTECLARGEPAAYCDCEARQLLDSLGTSLIDTLYGINDALAVDQRAELVVAQVRTALAAAGLPLAALPELRERVADIQGAVTAFCRR